MNNQQVTLLLSVTQRLNIRRLESSYIFQRLFFLSQATRPTPFVGDNTPIQIRLGDIADCLLLVVARNKCLRNQLYRHPFIHSITGQFLVK